MNKESSNLIEVRSKRLVTPNLKPDHELEDGVEDRQSKVPGFEQNKIATLNVLMVGAGGLGSEIGEGLVRKGVGALYILDPDAVELSNLNRQKFHKEDLYKNKAHCLAKNLQNEGAMGTKLISQGISFQQAVKEQPHLMPDIVICGVDNDPARIAVSRFCVVKEIPAIFTAVSMEADHGYVMIQKPGEACWGCAFPESVNNNREPCPGSPAVKDILKLMGAIVLYAVDSLFMERVITWSYRDVYLSDPSFDSYGSISKKDDCPICGN
ncbi:MAG: ThiF family adenylyltransferase [Candidatus Aenigmatarchaeota archaeon]